MRHDSEVDGLLAIFRVCLGIIVRFIAMLETERQRIEQLTAGWDDPTQIDWAAEEHGESDQAKLSVEGGVPAIVYKCVALYSYTVREGFPKFSKKFYSNFRHKTRMS